MAFIRDDGAAALELATATLVALRMRNAINLDDVEAALRSRSKQLPIDQSPDIDAALEVLQDLREGR